MPEPNKTPYSDLYSAYMQRQAQLSQGTPASTSSYPSSGRRNPYGLQQGAYPGSVSPVVATGNGYAGDYRQGYRTVPSQSPTSPQSWMGRFSNKAGTALGKVGNVFGRAAAIPGQVVDYAVPDQAYNAMGNLGETIGSAATGAERFASSVLPEQAYRALNKVAQFPYRIATGGLGDVGGIGSRREALRPQEGAPVPPTRFDRLSENAGAAFGKVGEAVGNARSSIGNAATGVDKFAASVLPEQAYRAFNKVTQFPYRTATQGLGDMGGIGSRRDELRTPEESPVDFTFSGQQEFSPSESASLLDNQMSSRYGASQLPTMLATEKMPTLPPSIQGAGNAPVAMDGTAPVAPQSNYGLPNAVPAPQGRMTPQALADAQLRAADAVARDAGAYDRSNMSPMEQWSVDNSVRNTLSSADTVDSNAPAGYVPDADYKRPAGAPWALDPIYNYNTPHAELYGGVETPEARNSYAERFDPESAYNTNVTPEQYARDRAAQAESFLRSDAAERNRQAARRQGQYTPVDNLRDQNAISGAFNAQRQAADDAYQLNRQRNLDAQAARDAALRAQGRDPVKERNDSSRMNAQYSNYLRAARQAGEKSLSFDEFSRLMQGGATQAAAPQAPMQNNTAAPSNAVAVNNQAPQAQMTRGQLEDMMQAQRNSVNQSRQAEKEDRERRRLVGGPSLPMAAYMMNRYGIPMTLGMPRDEMERQRYIETLGISGVGPASYRANVIAQQNANLNNNTADVSQELIRANALRDTALTRGMADVKSAQIQADMLSGRMDAEEAAKKNELIRREQDKQSAAYAEHMNSSRATPGISQAARDDAEYKKIIDIENSSPVPLTPALQVKKSELAGKLGIAQPASTQQGYGLPLNPANSGMQAQQGAVAPPQQSGGNGGVATMPTNPIIRDPAQRTQAITSVLANNTELTSGNSYQDFANLSNQLAAAGVGNISRPELLGYIQNTPLGVALSNPATADNYLKSLLDEQQAYISRDTRTWADYLQPLSMLVGVPNAMQTEYARIQQLQNEAAQKFNQLRAPELNLLKTVLGDGYVNQQIQERYKTWQIPPKT